MFLLLVKTAEFLKVQVIELIIYNMKQLTRTVYL